VKGSAGYGKNGHLGPGRLQQPEEAVISGTMVQVHDHDSAFRFLHQSVQGCDFRSRHGSIAMFLEDPGDLHPLTAGRINYSYQGLHKIGLDW
jgi:hypothetical protein